MEGDARDMKLLEAASMHPDRQSEIVVAHALGSQEMAFH
jgi:hypothetical protein